MTVVSVLDAALAQTAGLGLYILGSGVLEGLERSAFCLSKTLPGASIKRSCLTLKIYLYPSFQDVISLKTLCHR